MQKRRLGRTDLSIAPVVFGGNVFGWTADAKTSFDLLDRFVAAGLNAIDTADVYSAWAPGNKGGESETIIGDVAEGARQSQRGHDRHQGRLADGAGQEGPVGALYRTGGRGVAEAARRRDDRPLSVALAGRDGAARRDARRLPAADRQGQDPLVRRLELQRRRSSPPRSQASKATACRATRSSQPEYNLYDRSGFEGRACAISASPRRSASSPITASPKDSWPASTARPPISARARAAAA